MPQDDIIVTIGESMIGDEDIPMPKYIAPLFRELTFGIIDDTLNYQYKELIPATDDGYLPTMGGEGVISDVPFENVDVADVIGGVTGEIVGEFAFGGIGAVLGAIIRPSIKGVQYAVKQTAKQIRIKPSYILENGVEVYKTKNKYGDMVAKIHTKDKLGRASAKVGPDDLPDYLSMQTIYVEPEVRMGKGGKSYKHELYNSMLEVSQREGKRGLSSAKIQRTSPITDRFWHDYGEGTVTGGKMRFTYDVLHNKTVPPMRTSEFNITPADKLSPIVTGNKLMEEGAKGVVPVRKLVGEGRYAPVRPGQGDVVDAWVSFKAEDVVKAPKDAEGLVDVKIKRPQ